MTGRPKNAWLHAVRDTDRYSRVEIVPRVAIAAARALSYSPLNGAPVAHACCNSQQASRNAVNPIMPARATRKWARRKVWSRSRPSADMSGKMSSRFDESSSNADPVFSSPKRSRSSWKISGSRISQGTACFEPSGIPTESRASNGESAARGSFEYLGGVIAACLLALHVPIIERRCLDEQPRNRWAPSPKEPT